MLAIRVIRAVIGSIQYAVVIAIVVLWAMGRRRTSELRVSNWGLQLTRGTLMSISTFLFVTGLTLMPIADAIAIAFAGPVIATALAALLLNERVRWRRWTAIAIGFTGVMVFQTVINYLPFSLVESPLHVSVKGITAVYLAYAVEIVMAPWRPAWAMISASRS